MHRLHASSCLKASSCMMSWHVHSADQIELRFLQFPGEGIITHVRSLTTETNSPLLGHEMRTQQDQEEQGPPSQKAAKDGARHLIWWRSS